MKPRKIAVLQQPYFSALEHSAFQFFRRNMLNDIPGNFFDATLWHDHLLSQSMAQPALRYGIIALASMRVQSRKALGISDPCFALKNYNKAIQEIANLTEQTGNVGLQLVLIASLLFATFELHQGAYEKARLHLAGGYRVFGSLDPSKNCATRSPESQIVLEQVLNSYERLMQQLSRYSMGLKNIGLLIKPSVSSVRSSHGAFVDLRSARRSLNTRGAAMRQLVARAEEMTRHSGATVYGELQSLQFEQLMQLESLSEWHRNMASAPPPSQQSFDEQQTRRLLNIGYLCCKLKISTALSMGEESVWDAFTPDFISICYNAQAFLLAERSKPFPFFTFLLDYGILASLDLVVRKCRHPKVRRFALRLLQQSSHQEGALSASLSVRRGVKVIQVEERGCCDPQEADEILESRRIEQIWSDGQSFPGKFICRRRCTVTELGWAYFLEDDHLEPMELPLALQNSDAGL